MRLLYFAYETLGQLRIQEMFDIVVDYPDSLPALKDTAACLNHTHLQVGLNKKTFRPPAKFKSTCMYL